MDMTAFFKMSYGLYVVSAQADGERAGCLINTAVQVTAEPPRISVAVNKENVGICKVARADGLFGFGEQAVHFVANRHEFFFIGAGQRLKVVVYVLNGRIEHSL